MSAEPARTAAGAAQPVELPRLVRFDRDYWLSRCTGFRAEGPDGRHGRVDAVLFGSRLDCPDFVVIRQGRLPPRRALVPIGDVVEIDPALGRVRLAVLDAVGSPRQWIAEWWRRAQSSSRPAS